MPRMTSHVPGNFSWFELATSDQRSAKEFYSNVFGWETEDRSIAQDQTYTILKVGGESVGGLFEMSAAELGRGIPPHWQVYIAVANADEIASKATSLGGMIIEGPLNVSDVGRMAVISDPTGAIFSIWEAGRRMGVQLLGEPRSFCWWELNTNDPDAASTFYTQLFGWSVSGDVNYTEWKHGEKNIGGMMKIQPEWGPVPPNWLSYVLVDNCDSTAGLVKNFGGKVIIDTTDIPNVGRFAVVSDPQGAVFALYGRK